MRDSHPSFHHGPAVYYSFRRRTCLFLSTLFALVAATQIGIASEPGFFDDVLGEWSGTGKSFGMSSHPQMKWERILGDRYIRLNYQNEIRDSSGGAQIFEGHAYYAIGDTRAYNATWFDSQGERHPIAAVVTGDTLIATWGTKSTKLGRTFYLLRGKGRLEVWDTIKRKNGSWHEFSRAILHRR